MAANGPAIELMGLTKFYGRRRGVEDLTFDVAPGEVFGFLGPNGAGKTTTLRMLVGLLRITAGSASVLGQDVASARPALRARIGYLPGALALYKKLTGQEYLTFAARMRRLDLDDRIADLARRLDLDLDRRIHDLSRGNQQKIGVVQAFMHDPDVLVLDEPTSGLDPIVQQEFEALVRQATDRGASVLLSSHVLSEVEQLAQRVAVIDAGRLIVVEHIDVLKRRAVRAVELAFPRPVDPAAYRALACVQDARAHGSQLTCSVVGAETELLRLAVADEVETVRTLEPSLEEIFMSLVTGGDHRDRRPDHQDVA